MHRSVHNATKSPLAATKREQALCTKDVEMHTTIGRIAPQSSSVTDLSELLSDSNVVPMPGTNRAVALDLARRGFVVFPCDANKQPLTTHGFRDATTDADQIRAWWRTLPDALPALPTGARNGFAVLDIDRHHADADGFAALVALGLDAAFLGSFSVDTPNTGRHVYFEWPEGLRCSATHLPNGLDIRGEGGYVIAPGAVLPDGRSYVARGRLDRSALPDWPAALLAPRRDDYDLPKPLGPDPLPVDWDEVRRALACIPPDCSRDEWVRVGMALHAASDGAQNAFELWDRWSSGATEPGKYMAREMPGQWRSFGRGEGVDIGTLFHIAGEHGWTRAPEVGPDDFEDLLPSTPSPRSRLTLLTPSECEAAPSRGYVIKGLVAPGDVACIFGAPGAGKSLLAPYLGYAVAQGRETFGMRCRQGGVLYVAAEDPHGMRGRVRALKDAHGDAPEFCLVEGVANLLAEKSADLAALVAAVRERKPALIVIDTLAMAFPGLEENDAKSMGRVVAIARKLAELGAAVVLIHHDTKAEGATPRGHSLLNGALDVALHVKRDENGVIRGKLTKNRNGPCDRDIAFKIAIEECGFDDDGDPVTLPRCFELMGAAPSSDTRLPPSAKAALDALENLGGRATEKTWREACAAGRSVSASDDRESRMKAFKRAAEKLSRNNRVTFANGFYCIPDPFDDCEDAP